MSFLPVPKVPALTEYPSGAPRHHHYIGIDCSTLSCLQNVKGRDCECSPSTWWGPKLFSNKSDYTIPKGLQQMVHQCGWSRCEPGLRVAPGAVTCLKVVCALKHPLPGYPASGGPRCWGSRRNPIFWCHPAHRPLPRGALPTLFASPKLFIERNH